jgi:hypothetical protein
LEDEANSLPEIEVENDLNSIAAVEQEISALKRDMTALKQTNELVGMRENKTLALEKQAEFIAIEIRLRRAPLLLEQVRTLNGSLNARMNSAVARSVEGTMEDLDEAERLQGLCNRTGAVVAQLEARADSKQEVDQRDRGFEPEDSWLEYQQCWNLKIPNKKEYHRSIQAITSGGFSSYDVYQLAKVGCHPNICSIPLMVG